MTLLVLQALLLIVFPAILITLQSKIVWAKPIVMAYVIGVIWGNIAPNWVNGFLLKEVTGVSVILAIPLLMFPMNLSSWYKQPKSILGAYAIAGFSTIIAVSIGYFLFQNEVDNIALISGMISGVYTGGTVNLNAIGMAFGAPNTIIVFLNAYDIAFSGVYLLFVFFAGSQLATKLLITKSNLGSDPHQATVLHIPKLDYLYSICYAIVVAGVVASISLLFTGMLNEIIMVFGVSILGAIAANISFISRNPASMIMADYLMVLFGLCLGLQANMEEMTLGSLELTKYFAVVFSIMLFIHYTLSRWFKVDGYESVLASVAAVFGPPFIGPVAKAIGRESLIPAGIAIALIGNVIGTYLGMFVVYILK